MEWNFGKIQKPNLCISSFIRYLLLFFFHSENIQYNLTLKRKQQENTCEIRRCKILVSNFPKVSLHSVKIKLIATFTLLPESQPSSSTIILRFWERFYTNMVHDVTWPDCKGFWTLIIEKLLKLTSFVLIVLLYLYFSIKFNSKFGKILFFFVDVLQNFALPQ